MSKNEELLPCPFCGFQTSYSENDKRVICRYCGGSRGKEYKTKEEAIKAWNTRFSLKQDKTISWPDELKGCSCDMSDEQGYPCGNCLMNIMLKACKSAYAQSRETK